MMHKLTKNAPQKYSLESDKWPKSTFKEDMLKVLNNANEMDNIHDGVFKVSGQIFPVHKYIIAHRSENLFSMLRSNSSNSPVEVQNIHPYIFKQLLIFIYTNSCDFIELGKLNAEVIKFCDIKIENNGNLYLDETDSVFDYVDKKQRKPKNVKDLNSKNPLVIMQQAAKRFGVKSLCKRIEKLIYCNGSICYKSLDYYYDNDVYFEFKREKYMNLFDVVIKPETGSEILAHKCVLSRIEYFNNLFAARWNEKSSKSIVTLPVSHEVVQAVIDFLYSNGILRNTYDLDYLTNVLIISDQLFIEDLKCHCEMYLSVMLTLRNVAEILQFAHTYNAANLRYNCENFIKHNLAAILESRSLEILDDIALDNLTKNYSYNEILSKRVITPFSDAPSDEELKSIYELYPLNVEDCEEYFDKKTPKTNRKKIRTRRTSHKTSESNLDSSFEHNTSFSETFEEEVIEKENKPDEKWVKILTDKQKHQKIVQNRLKAITNAKEELESEKICDNLIKLTPHPKNESPEKIKPVSNPVDMKCPTQIVESIKSPTMSDIPIQKAQRLSQKKRKKLAQEVSISSMAQDLDEINKKSWNNIMWSKDSNSFSDVMKNETQQFPELGIGSASPKNPWQKVDITSPISSPETKKDFRNIVADEKKLKENWTKMRDRPLIYIQMEDKAINDLERFYNIDKVTDEHITIHKVEKGAFAVPMWVQPNNKH